MTWGAPKIHGELLKLGFVVWERTVARCLRRVRRRGDPAQRWLAFLRNHREVMVAFDFFSVPTVTFKLLDCFFVIAHGRRKILHFNVTRHPPAAALGASLAGLLTASAHARHTATSRCHMAFRRAANPVLTTDTYVQWLSLPVNY